MERNKLSAAYSVEEKIDVKIKKWKLKLDVRIYS
jgi:hypothetical protein